MTPAMRDESIAARAARHTDLDAACLTVQDAIGQDDGGIAAIFFSGKDDEWEVADRAARKHLLLAYIAFERRFR